MNNILYSLLKHNISSENSKYYARVSPYKSMTLDDIVEDMKEKGTGSSETDMRATLQLFFESVTKMVSNGYNVNLPVANFKPGISGLFDDLTDVFDPARHSLKVNVTTGYMPLAGMRDVVVEKVKSTLPKPDLIAFSDINSGLTNERITSNGIGTILGNELKFNPENPEEGVFFVNGTTTRVEVLAARTEGKLMFSIPQLAPGSYALEVRKGYKTTNEIRKGALSELLIVQ
ncbi:MAG TPA: DNA-binding domain-containing protein [Cytophagales bacterium]|nr:DNA-binding domain-containing protein [Cytophagales bacterium]